MSRDPDVESVVNAIVGAWEGHGEGGYPTIEPFKYRESLRITERADHPALHYEQKTWRDTGEGEVVSHWETGLIRLSSDGSAMLNNAQPGRVEVMAGRWKAGDEGWQIHLSSRGFAGDNRVVNSTRTIHLAADSLIYDMYMETTATHTMHLHLAAKLTRA